MKPMQLSDLPAKHHAEVLRQLNRNKPVGIARAEQVRTESKPRIRQSSRGLNKTEAAFELWLREHHADGVVLSQAITLKLANGVRYSPDFVTVDFSPAGPGRILTAYEVKGFMRDDAAVKLKVAAGAYPWIQFVLVTRAGGTWQREDVLS